MGRFTAGEHSLTELVGAMSLYIRTIAYGSECAAWGDFIADCYDTIDMPPWSDHAVEAEAPEPFLDYWQLVAAGKSPDYHPKTGARR